MEWDYIAESPEALAAIGEKLLKGPTKKALDEQLQLTRLLEGLNAERPESKFLSVTAPVFVGRFFAFRGRAFLERYRLNAVARTSRASPPR